MIQSHATLSVVQMIFVKKAEVKLRALKLKQSFCLLLIIHRRERVEPSTGSWLRKISTSRSRFDR